MNSLGLASARPIDEPGDQADDDQRGDRTRGGARRADAEWHQTACILCECNCGIEVRLGGDDGRRFERIRGDKAHPMSQGYTCEKALRLDHYQNPGGRTVAAPGVPGPGSRLTHPLRRRPDGTFEEVDWDTAIGEVAARLGAVRDAHGGDAIFYFGGGGQGNHLGGAYASASLAAFGAGRHRSNALAQEKTGEFWVNAQMFGTNVRGEIEHGEVVVFIGKNPWQSHSFPRARTTLKEIARDPARSMIVVDPRRTETAELADIHLQVRPGTDAWLIAALAAAIVDEGLVDRAWVAEHTTGADEVVNALAGVDIAGHWAVAGVAEDDVRAGRPADRAGRQRRRVRGPGRADEPALHARQLPREAGVGADRQLRQAGRPVRGVGHGAARQGAAGRGDRGRRRTPQPRGRRPHRVGAGAVQRDPRRDPHRPPRPLPGDGGRERQPRPLARRLAPHARGAGRHSTRSSSSTSP